VRTALDAVIRVMKTVPAVWDAPKPRSTSIDAQLSGRTSVEQYLRWGKLPDVERILERDGPWPGDSSAGARIAGMLATHPHLAPLREPFEVLDRLLEANGAPARYAYAQACEAFDRRDDDACLGAAEDALALQPDYPNAAHLAGWALLRKHEARRAIAYLERAVTLAPRETDPLIHLCDALVEASRGAEAVARMERATADAATAKHAHNWLGWYFTRHDRDLPRAIEALESSLRGHSWGVAWLNYAWALELAGRREDAFIAYSAALLSTECYDRPWAEEHRAALAGGLRGEGKAVFDPADWVGQAASFAFVAAVREVAEEHAGASTVAAIRASEDVRWGAAAEPLERIADRVCARGDGELAASLMATACAAYDATAEGLAHEAEGEDARAQAERARAKLARMRRS
jgi:tetratricopeptide (TPR) repeat protein